MADVLHWLGETRIVAQSNGDWIFLISLFVLPWAIIAYKG
jgi:hypothetical protein